MTAGNGLPVAPLRHVVGKFLFLVLLQQDAHRLSGQIGQAFFAVLLNLLVTGQIQESASYLIHPGRNLSLFVGNLHLLLQLHHQGGHNGGSRHKDNGGYHVVHIIHMEGKLWLRKEIVERKGKDNGRAQGPGQAAGSQYADEHPQQIY